MKAILISIQPKWCELIASGKKTIEVRKTRPKIETPFKCYIYCTGVKFMPLMEYVEIHRKTGGRIDDWHSKVIGEFVCDYTIDLGKRYAYAHKDSAFYEILRGACLTDKDLQKYSPNGTAVAWHISDFKIYDEPKELGEFRSLCKYDDRDCCACPYYDYSKLDCDRRTIKRPQQSWCYVEEL